MRTLCEARAGHCALHGSARSKGPCRRHGLGCRLKQLNVFLDNAPACDQIASKALSALEKRKASRDAIVHGDGQFICVSARRRLALGLRGSGRREIQHAGKAGTFRIAEADLFENDLERGVQSVLRLALCYLSPEGNRPTVKAPISQIPPSVLHPPHRADRPCKLVRLRDFTRSCLPAMELPSWTSTISTGAAASR